MVFVLNACIVTVSNLLVRRDFELAALDAEHICEDNNNTGNTCVQEKVFPKRCFSSCPFIVSHGSLTESLDGLGFSFPETLFKSVAEFVKVNPNEIVTLYLISSHGNKLPSSNDILQRMNSSGLLKYVWNSDPQQPFTQYPLLGEMRKAKKTVFIASAWGPDSISSHFNATGIQNPGEHCEAGTPCMEGWDAITFDNLDPAKIVLNGSPSNKSIFLVENLSSRRGRDPSNAKYWPLPHELEDFPFQAGGNPVQASQAANYSHIVALEKAWRGKLEPFGLLPSVILVDFFNTTTPVEGKVSRSLLPNPNDGLIQAVKDINAQRARELL